MRTVADLRRSLGIGAPRNRDSLYAPIERAPRTFNPLRIPKKLQVKPTEAPSVWFQSFVFGVLQTELAVRAHQARAFNPLRVPRKLQVQPRPN